MKRIKGKSYKEQGITLVALVITIIILLILAGVTLNTALSDNGLFARAKEASEKYKESEEQEKEALDDIEKELDGIIQTKEKAKAGEKVSIPEGKEWDENKVDAVADGEGNVIPVPNGFYYAGGSKSTGFVISDTENDDLDNSREGNQFVWIPCTEDQYNDAKDDVMDEQWSCNNEYKDNGNSNGEKTTEGTGDGKAWKNDYIGDEKEILDNIYNNDNKLPTEKWKNENQITKGQESIKKYGGYYIARYEAGIPEEADFYVSKSNSEMKYVNTKKENIKIPWGSNTIGRGSKDDTGIIKDLKPVSKKGVQAWNYITQPNSKRVAENMYNESNSVNSYLVDSQAWNHICKSIFHANKGNNDSTTWGNYYNNTTTAYKSLNCLWAGHQWNEPDWEWNIAEKYEIGGIQDEDIPKGEGIALIELSTGASDDFKKYNIYDMAGNMWEWTTEHNVVTTDENTKKMFVVLRGGSFSELGSDHSVVRADGGCELITCNWCVGFRVVLYIE